jgi:hypothetical protein
MHTKETIASNGPPNAPPQLGPRRITSREEGSPKSAEPHAVIAPAMRKAAVHGGRRQGRRLPLDGPALQMDYRQPPWLQRGAADRRAPLGLHVRQPRKPIDVFMPLRNLHPVCAGAAATSIRSATSASNS